MPEQREVLPQLIRLARELEIPLVATNDSHYLTKEDSRMHHVLICIQTGKTVEDEDVLEFGSDEFYVKSTEEMYQLFASVRRHARTPTELRSGATLTLNSV